MRSYVLTRTSIQRRRQLADRDYRGNPRLSIASRPLLGISRKSAVQPISRAIALPLYSPERIRLRRRLAILGLVKWGYQWRRAAPTRFFIRCIGSGQPSRKSLEDRLAPAIYFFPYIFHTPSFYGQDSFIMSFSVHLRIHLRIHHDLNLDQDVGRDQQIDRDHHGKQDHQRVCPELYASASELYGPEECEPWGCELGGCEPGECASGGRASHP
jgi:hypothetical protein